MRCRLLAICLLFGVWAGCGTTKWTDTSRTGTEQLLISDAIERAVSRLDFRAIAGKKVYLDDSYIKSVTDTTYLVSSLRQHILASGAILKDKREDADYIVEVRAGAVGTDRHDILFGVPQTTIPSIVPYTPATTTIPEIPLVKRTEQRGVTKIAVFAYNRQTGRPLWQSGTLPSESTAKAVWVLGAGPFQRGHIYEGTKFAGDRFSIPLIDIERSGDGQAPRVSVAEEAYFTEPHEEPARKSESPVAQGQPKTEGGPSPPGGAPPAAATPAGVVQASLNRPGAPAGQPEPASAKPTDDPQAAPPPATALPGTSAPTTPFPHATSTMPPAGPIGFVSQPAGDAPTAPGAPAPTYPVWTPDASRLPAPDLGPSALGPPYPTVDPLPYYRR